MAIKRIIITEEQEKILVSTLLYENTSYPVEPDKVLLVSNFLDKHFKRANMSSMNDNGEPTNTPIVGMMDNNGNVIKNMTDKQLFDYMQEKFKNIYVNNIQRNKFLAQVIKDWYNKKISREGMLSTNSY